MTVWRTDSLVELEDSFAHCAAEVRRDDRDRFLSSLFAAPDGRRNLTALHAFALELARVPETVSEPLVGQMRLKWWFDALVPIANRNPPRHPVAEALAAVAPGRFPHDQLEALVEARLDDLSPEPPASLAALEAHARATAGRAGALAVRALDVFEDAVETAAEDAATAHALTLTLLAVPVDAQRRRLCLPADLCRDVGVEVSTLLATSPTESPPAGLADVAASVAARARELLGAARRQRKAVPRAALPALLPARLTERRLAALERARFNPFDPRIPRSIAAARPGPADMLALLGAAMGNRY